MHLLPLKIIVNWKTAMKKNIIIDMVMSAYKNKDIKKLKYIIETYPKHKGKAVSKLKRLTNETTA